MKPRTKDSVSRDARNTRERLRRKSGALDRDLDILYKETGYKPVEQWDFEELARGKPRNPDGTWRHGGKPKWITGRIQAEVQKRLRDEGFVNLSSHLVSAIKTLVDLMTSKEKDENGRFIVDSPTRLSASKFVIEQILGKAKQSVEIDSTQSFRDFLASALVLSDGSAAHPVIEGSTVQVVDEDDDE